jgi:hypothetical protein
MADKDLPPDLQDTSTPVDATGDYYNVFISDLDPKTPYKIQFRWQNEDGTYGEEWSPVFNVTTDDETVETPSFQSDDIALGEPGYIKVKWDGNNSSGQPLKNYKQINVLAKKKGTVEEYIKVGSINKLEQFVSIKMNSGTYLVVLQTETSLGNFSTYSQSQEIVTYRKPTAVTDISYSWLCNGGLKINWNHNTTLDSSSNYNKGVTQYKIFLTEWDGTTEGQTAEFLTTVINRSSSAQSFIVTREENIYAFDYHVNRFKIRMVAWEDKDVYSEDTSYSSMAAYSSCLLPPVITATKDVSSYSVRWSFASGQDPLANVSDIDKITIQEFVLENPTLVTSYTASAPATTPVVISSGEYAGSYNWYEVKANTIDNPVQISTAYNTPSGIRWVRAKFVDKQGVSTGWSTPVKVKPDQLTSVDDTAPEVPTGLAVTPQILTADEVLNGKASFKVDWANADIATYEKHGGVVIAYKKSIDSSYTEVFVYFTTQLPLTSKIISGFTQNTLYNFKIAAYNVSTGRASEWSTPDVNAISSTDIAPSAPISPTVFASDSTDLAFKSGPFMVRVRQEAKKANNNPLEDFISYFEVWAIPASYTTATDSAAQRIGTLKSAAPNGNMTYTEANFSVNPIQNSPVQLPKTSLDKTTPSASFKFYTKAVGTNGKVSEASALTAAKPILFLTDAYISDLSADKITTGTLAATEYITVGTGDTAIKIESGATDASTIIRSGTGIWGGSEDYATNGTGAPGFYVDATGKFSLKNKLYFNGADQLTLDGRIVINSHSELDSEIKGNLKFTDGSLYQGTIEDGELTSANGFILNSKGFLLKRTVGTVGQTGYRVKEVGFGLPDGSDLFTVTAEAGDIGNWQITTEAISSSNITLNSNINNATGTNIKRPAITLTDSGSSNWLGLTTPEGDTALLKAASTVLWAGESNYANRSTAKFRVTGGGKVIAQDAEIKGFVKSGLASGSTTVYKVQIGESLTRYTYTLAGGQVAASITAEGLIITPNTTSTSDYILGDGTFRLGAGKLTYDGSLLNINAILNVGTPDVLTSGTQTAGQLSIGSGILYRTVVNNQNAISSMNGISFNDSSALSDYIKSDGKFRLAGGKVTYDGTIFKIETNLIASNVFLGTSEQFDDDYLLGKSHTNMGGITKPAGSFSLAGGKLTYDGSKFTLRITGATEATGGLKLSEPGSRMIGDGDVTYGDQTLVVSRSTGFLTGGRVLYYGGNRYPTDSADFDDSFLEFASSGDLWFSRKA